MIDEISNILTDPLALAPPNAADLVLDMLWGYPEAGMPVQTLCKAGEIVGVPASNVRVALTRLVQQSKLTKTTRGHYVIDPAGHPLSAEVGHWLDKEQQIVAWDGRWFAVHNAAVASSDRAGWRRHQRALAVRGFRPLADGLHLRPSNLRGGVQAVRQQLSGLGLLPAALVFEITGLDEASHQAATRLWAVEELETAYRQLTQALADSRRRLPGLSLAAAARESLLLGRAVIRRIVHDPMLPASMMKGDDRHRLIESMRDYQEMARAIWVEALA